VIRKQVMSMVTDTKRIRMTDPGHPRTCNVCGFYKFFFDDWEHYWDLCRKAQIGCRQKKELLAERIIKRFAPFRERRASLTRERIDSILEAGAESAYSIAGKTMDEVRDAVGLPPYRRT
jgi:tryptophanyl-tRNA synthetase